MRNRDRDAPEPALIAVDWGTSRFRATLVAKDGSVLGRVEADDGMAHVPPGGFGAVLMRHCQPWLAVNAALPVIMGGMVGSRNGWIEAPYAAAPATLADLTSAMVPAPRPDGGPAFIVPGVSGIFAGAADVMRGEETIVMGLALDRGLVCQPGTHSKWIEVVDGRIERFATFMTGELFAAAMEHTIIGRLATQPTDGRGPGFERGLAAAEQGRALSHALFQARADVLLGRLGGDSVREFVSGLFVGHEIAEARRLFGQSAKVSLVATADQAERYGRALTYFGMSAEIVDVESAFLAGLTRIAAGLAKTGDRT